MRRVLPSLLAWLLLISAAFAQTVPIYGRSGMVVTVEARATEVGVQILRDGGNAFDSAVAVGFALAVTCPAAGNIGGGGFCVALDTKGATYALDFRETAPAAATKDMFLDPQGEVAKGRSLNTHLAVGVPGTVDGLLELHKRFGRLPLRQVLAPAIGLARKGFPVSQSLSSSLRASAERLKLWRATAAQFYPEGSAPEMGQILVQEDLADSLERIAASGRSGFYEGRTAQLIVEEMRRNRGLITAADLKNYRSKWREPFTFRSGEYEIAAMPLPSSGGVTLAQILGMSDLGALKESGHNSARYIHLLTEAERLAYADRNHYLGDPDFVQVPLALLTSPAYLAERRKLMPQGRAGVSAKVSPGKAEKMETTHYCTADRWGNVVAITYTLNGGYGMGAVVEGAGFLLNNEMDDFTSKPGVPNLYGLVQSDRNAIAPGKRMLSSMTPIIVRRNGQFFMTVGSPGGSTIITTVLQCLLNVTLFDMNIRDAIEAERFHHQWLPDEVAHEDLSPDTLALLKGMGYTLKAQRLGIAAGIMRTRTNLLSGWADGRADGRAAGF